MYRSLPWFLSTVRVLIVVCLSVLVGYYFNQVTLALLVGVSGLLMLHYWHIYQLNYWIAHSKRFSPPETLGIWTRIFQGVHQRNILNRNKRKALAETIRFFQQGSEALPDAAVVVDNAGDIRWCNRLARIELGISWPQDSKQNIFHYVNNSEFTDYYQGKQFAKPLEINSTINPDKILEYRVVPYADERQMIMIRDVTRLIQIEKMRKNFVANVSHELKTPLTVINGYLEMLPENGDMPEAMMKKALSEMRSQSERMRTLIEELLVLSRIEASTERAFEKLVNVPQLLWQIQSEAEALNRQKKHKLFFDISSILNVYGIESELRSAFSNLIFNAIHYTPAGGVIEVKWALDGYRAKFSVKDNGEGIAAEHINQLTERFYRVDKARSRTTGGSGLGLAIVKHALSHHNSALKIHSQVGKGSTFSCVFSAELTHITEKSIPVK